VHHGKIATAVEAVAEQAAQQQHDQWRELSQRPSEPGFIRRSLEHADKQPGK